MFNTMCTWPTMYAVVWVTSGQTSTYLHLAMHLLCEGTAALLAAP